MVVTESLLRPIQTVRAAEADELRAVLGSLDDRLGRVAELIGEPGSGKTRLLADLAEEAGQRGAVVLRGRATEASSTMRCQVLIDTLGRWAAAGLDDQRLDALGALVRQLSFGPGPQTIPADVPPSRWVCHYYATLVLQLRACAGDGLVILLDDAHWLDEGTLELLDYLVQRPVSAPVAVVASYRPKQAPAQLAGLFAHGIELGTADRVELGPLDARRSAALLGMPADSPALRRLHREAGGSPLYLLALAGEAAARAESRGADGGEDEAEAGEPALPVQFTARISAEFAALDEDQQQAAAAGAVLGPRFDAAGVAALTGLAKGVTCGLLDGLVRRDLVRAVPGTDQLAFRHPLVRRAVYAAVDSCWRIEAHRKALDFLAVRGVPNSELAEHVQRSGPGDGERDHMVLAAAAREALGSGDTRSAASLLPQALRLLAVRGRAEEAVELRALARRVGEASAAAGEEAMLGCGVPLPAGPATRYSQADASVTLLSALTEREREVADLASTGQRTRQIAAELRLSPRTVDVHLTRIYRKLNISSRAALARLVVESGRRVGDLAG